jgi:hypothetical protein
MSLPTPHAPKNNVCCVCGKSGGAFDTVDCVLRLKADVAMMSSSVACFAAPDGARVHIICHVKARTALDIISKNNLRKAFD